MYTFESRIRYSECDLNCYLTIESLINYFQDCSTFQTQLGPATMEAMSKKGIAWVLNSWQVVVRRLPKLGENVVIGTLPYELRGFMGLRNFFMKTDEGEELAIANSVWSLIDLEKGTPSRIDDSIIRTYPLDEKLPMDYAPRKITMPKDAARYEGDDKRVGMHHLDTNNHVNNGQYIRMALQACAQVSSRENLEDIKDLPTCRENIQIRAEYRQQAHLGFVIHPVVYNLSDTKGCTVYLNDEEGQPYSIVELKRITFDPYIIKI